MGLRDLIADFRHWVEIWNRNDFFYEVFVGLAGRTSPSPSWVLRRILNRNEFFFEFSSWGFRPNSITFSELGCWRKLEPKRLFLLRLFEGLKRNLGSSRPTIITCPKWVLKEIESSDRLFP